MSIIRITCWLTVVVLGAVSLSLAVQHGPTPGSAAPATAGGTAPENTGSTASKNTESPGRKVLELTVGLGGFRMPCVDCHKNLGSPSEDPIERGRGPHQHVVLKHGENNRCFNCHHSDIDEYGSFIRHDGSVIPVETVEQLCGKCHGAHYRAWKQGSHGQWTGHWDLSSGPRESAHCNSCHDPHQPYFKPISTLPGPRSLRGEPLPDHPCRKAH